MLDSVSGSGGGSLPDFHTFFVLDKWKVQREVKKILSLLLKQRGQWSLGCRLAVTFSFVCSPHRPQSEQRTTIAWGNERAEKTRTAPRKLNIWAFFKKICL